MSLLELQKFLLEYQRVSSALARGRDDGMGTGRHPRAAVQWGWGDACECSAWHSHSLSTSSLSTL